MTMDIATIIASAFSLLGAAAVGFIALRNNAFGVTRDVISSYKTRVEQLETKVATCEDLHRRNLESFGALKGEMIEKEKRIHMLESILQNRNPEMDQFMQTMLATAQAANEHMKYSRLAFDALLEAQGIAPPKPS